MNKEELEDLLKDVESDRVERTESLNDTKKHCEAICAFSNDLPNNRKPGYLFIGARGDGTLSGADITDQLLQNLAAHRSEGHILPVPVMNVQKVVLSNGEIAVVEVFPSDMPPVRYKGRVCIRVGPRRAVASETEERMLSERRTAKHKTWDLRGCLDSTLDDLALDLFTLNYLPEAVDRAAIKANDRSMEERLAALRFLDIRTSLPTNAAVLLFGKDPRIHVDGAYVQYVRYDGREQADDVLTERRLSGDLIHVMRDLDSLAREVANARPARDESLRDLTIYDYPPIALHEVLMNAVIHRNYESSTTPIMINHFSDRIEISNPGSLYGDLTRDRFPHGTAYRNPVLAEAAKTLGFVNRYGRGIAVAEAELKKNASPPLDFDIGENHLAVIVRRRP